MCIDKAYFVFAFWILLVGWLFGRSIGRLISFSLLFVCSLTLCSGSFRLSIERTIEPCWNVIVCSAGVCMSYLKNELFECFDLCCYCHCCCTYFRLYVLVCVASIFISIIINLLLYYALLPVLLRLIAFKFSKMYKNFPFFLSFFFSIQILLWSFLLPFTPFAIDINQHQHCCSVWWK